MRAVTLRAAVVVMSVLMLAGVTLAPRLAEACGGFFCSNTPIDQSAERIIFAQHNNEVKAWVQIVFTGNAEDFAWVVPVAAVPDVDVAESILFQDIDQATAPVIIPPACAFPPMAAGADGDAESTGGGGSRADDGVIVYSESDVGPYHTATVGSESSELLINWLNENGYIITPAMYPMVDAYVQDGMLFLAMKLQVGQGVDALQPILMTYEADRPVIPIRLTAVAADPNMGILVWILGDSRAVSANFSTGMVDIDRIRFDGLLRSNYRTLVTQTVDEAGGQAFVTEYAGPTEEVPVFSEQAIGVLSEYAWLTRLYTTMSPEEMTTDPVFTFNSALGPVSNVIDLSDRSDLCEDPANSPCDFNYCGPDSTCYVTDDGAAACDCGSDTVARGVADPVMGTAITCVPEDRDMLEEVTDDPCASVTCGELGQCINVNGNATCSCRSGSAATLGVAGLTCADLGFAQLDPREIDIRPGVGDSPAGGEMGCSTAPGTPNPWGGLLLLLTFGCLLGIPRSRA